MSKDRNDDGITLIGPSAPRASDKKLGFDLRFRLINEGHTPANVSIGGHIADEDSKGGIYTSKNAEDTCKATAQVSEWNWTIFPESSMIFDAFLDIDGKETSISELRIGRPALYGCIVYRQVGDPGTHNTPFVGRLSMLKVDGLPPPPGLPISPDFSKGPIPSEKLCIIDILIVGKAS